jgi:O-antigen/teichoic acid export membrane protein/pyruvate-formate lyase-activating enzyme
MTKELKKLLKEAFIYGIGRQVNMLLSIMLVPIYTRIFLPSDYGVLELANTAVYFLMAVLGLGIEDAGARFFYDYKTDRQKEVIATAFYFRLVVCAAAFFILLPFARQCSLFIFKSDAYASLCKLAFLQMCLTLMMVLSINVLRLRFKPVQYSIVNITNILLTSGITIYLVVFRRVGVIGIFGASCVSTFCSLILAVALSREFFKPAFSLGMLKEQLAYGVPLVPLLFFYWAMRYSDRYFLSRLATLDDLGLYSIGARLAGILALFTFAFQRAWGPFVFYHKDQKDAKAIFSKAFDHYTLFLFSASAFISLFAKEVLRFITSPVYLGGYKVVGLLCFGTVVLMLRSFFELGINISKKTHITAVTVGLGVLLNITLNIILIPKIGMTGAAVSTLSSYVFSGALAFLLADKYYPMRYDFFKLSKVVALATVMVALGIFLNINNLVWSLGVKLLATAGYIIALPLLGVINRQELFWLRSMPASLRNKMTFTRAGNRIFTPPLRRVALELTNRCNLSCELCTARMPGSREQGFMDFSLYKKIVDEIAGVKNIQLALSHGGEALLHREFVPMLEYASGRGLRNIGIVTNGMLFEGAAADAFLKYSDGLVNFSLDGFQESHNRLRKGSDYRRVLSNVEEFLKKRKASGKKTPRVCVNMTRYDQPEQEVDDFLRYWAGRVDHVYIREPLDERIRFLKKNGLADEIIRAGRRPCLDIWTYLVVLWNGDVTLCCHDIAGRGVNGLNVNTMNIRDIYKGAAYKRLRDSHIKSRFAGSPICRDCQAWCKNYAGSKTSRAGADGVFWATKTIYTNHEDTARSC